MTHPSLAKIHLLGVIEHYLDDLSVGLEVKKHQIFRCLSPSDDSPAGSHFCSAVFQVIFGHLAVLTLDFFDHMTQTEVWLYFQFRL